MSAVLNYLSSSLRFQTASPVIFADKENGDQTGVMSIAFFDGIGDPTVPATAVTTLIQYRILRPTSIYRISLFSEADPSGIFYFQIGQVEHISNFDLSFLSESKKHEFILPDRTFIESIVNESEKTMRFIIRNHVLGQQKKYQITIDSVEYV